MKTIMAVCLLLLSLFAAHAAAAGPTFDFSVSVPPELPKGLKFNDTWGPKLKGKPEGNTYDPMDVDWSSVIQSVREICKFEMRMCNWCVRAAFHDGGSNEVGLTEGESRKVVTAGKGGFDASLLLTNETLRFENVYRNFSTFVAAIIRKLVGFYNISYADGLAVCGAVATEMLSNGQTPVYDFMPARDPTNRATPKVHFLVGRLDDDKPNPENQLVSPFAGVKDFADFWKERFNRGVYDGVALLGSHTALDNQGCVEGDSGRFRGIKRMFSWNAVNSYYKDLLTPSLGGPIRDQEASKFPRKDPPRKVLTPEDVEVCRFTSKSFQKQARDKIAAGTLNLTNDVETAFEWTENTRAGKVTRRTCDRKGNCYDGWPYTSNDGFLGVAAQQAKPADADSREVKAAVRAFRNREGAWDAAYANAYNRLTVLGAEFTPKTRASRGMKISGWECKEWVAGDARNLGRNRSCQNRCRSRRGCSQSFMKAPLFCRCSTSPWGMVAVQELYPNTEQTIVADVKGNVTAPPLEPAAAPDSEYDKPVAKSEIDTTAITSRRRRALLSSNVDTVAAAVDGAAPKAKCPLEMLRNAGLLK